MLSSAQQQQFKIDGYLKLPRLIGADEISALRQAVEDDLAQRVEPFELETDVQYPGAPDTIDAPGGATIRRLKSAYARGPQFSRIATLPHVVNAVQQILETNQVWLNPNHHNCIMTKHPEFSSATLWHRDTRYWHFSDKYLINSWIALGEESEANGAMMILPGSHRWEVTEDALDADQFLITDHPDAVDRVATARVVTLNAGDVLLFSAHCFHAAGQNHTDVTKLSMVFTYHGETTQPIEGTVSNSNDEIRLK